MKQDPLNIVIVSGLSGSGKSTVIRALEDQGYYCVDNMPPQLLPHFLETIEDDPQYRDIALGVDVRAKRFLAKTAAAIETLGESDCRVRLIYTEADNEALIRRYSETRRLHPLDRRQGLADAIQCEREALAELRRRADYIIDTSRLSPHQLRAQIDSEIAGARTEDNLRVAIMSFGYKFGLPPDADLALDVRFIPNPYFVPDLKPLTGKTQAVQEFIFKHPEAQEFRQRTIDFLTFLIPQYQREGKRRLTVAIGCTGGQHRSVALTLSIGEALSAAGFPIDLRHRDIKEATP